MPMAALDFATIKQLSYSPGAALVALPHERRMLPLEPAQIDQIDNYSLDRHGILAGELGPQAS